ncbi:hypothetical protein GCM10010124_18040 [Pilimelia terevasa]|uniref:Peptidase M10 metallopeptidase domain-containing protein n=1 Tax=Pilimelia terevasa TaxID=53372 RepID=A0A8J3BP88_9ACTN|nr:hypothetical protein [Pilimelia terevasa]GGK25911.1 hypothetical protein GCM10010124_18040 [Pilimelia terevasa]
MRFGVRRILAAAVVGALGAGTMAAPAAAATRVTYVNVSAGVKARWGVGAAVRALDRYAGSTARFGPCRSGAKCIVIREARRTPCDRYTRAGWAAGCADLAHRTWLARRYTITLNPRLRDPGDRSRAARHELGHVYGLAWHHAGDCRLMMYPTTRCPDGRPTLGRLTSADLRRVRAN